MLFKQCHYGLAIAFVSGLVGLINVSSLVASTPIAHLNSFELAYRWQGATSETDKYLPTNRQGLLFNPILVLGD